MRDEGDQMAALEPGVGGGKRGSLQAAGGRQCGSVSSCCKLITSHRISVPTGGAGVKMREAPLILQFSGLGQPVRETFWTEDTDLPCPLALPSFMSLEQREGPGAARGRGG